MTPVRCPSLSHWGAFTAPPTTTATTVSTFTGNANVLTEDRGTSRLAQGASALSALVDVACWPHEAPAVRVTQHPPPTD